MKKHLMTILALMVVMAISTTVMAGSRDDRDSSYLNSVPAISAPADQSSPIMNRKDLRDLSYLNGQGTSGTPIHKPVTRLTGRDVKDLGYLFDNSSAIGGASHDDSLILCCQR